MEDQWLRDYDTAKDLANETVALIQVRDQLLASSGAGPGQARP